MGTVAGFGISGIKGKVKGVCLLTLRLWELWELSCSLCRCAVWLKGVVVGTCGCAS